MKLINFAYLNVTFEVVLISLVFQCLDLNLSSGLHDICQLIRPTLMKGRYKF